ncbi:MAG: ABC transporter permease, partial [Chitinophagales bacterium]|nr:ABC transporter permease [Chitinophagales bacterium]
MLRLIWLECFKIIKKPRSYIGFAAITVIVTLIQVALLADGDEYISFILQSLEQSFLVEGKLLNGYLVCFIILQTLIVQMPLLVALVTGDLVSGEAAAGTLRLLLTRPFSRTQIIIAKWLSGAIYTFILLCWLGALALGVSLMLFGEGDLMVLKNDALVILRSNDVLWRYITALSLAFLSLLTVATFSLMLSCLSDNSIGPIVSAMAVIILFTIIGSLDVPLFDKIKPFLFTTHMIIWRNMFDSPVPLQQIIISISVLVVHITIFLSFSLIYFRTK